jgi:hypothetical protein
VVFFLAQLAISWAMTNCDQIIKEYYNTWKFKHPAPNDFKRVAERKVSGFESDWYLIDWTMTTNTIDYAVDGFKTENGTAMVASARH